MRRVVAVRAAVLATAVTTAAITGLAAVTPSTVAAIAAARTVPTITPIPAPVVLTSPAAAVTAVSDPQAGVRFLFFILVDHYTLGPQRGSHAVGGSLDQDALQQTLVALEMEQLEELAEDG
jgi:hypothetical protein